MPLRCKCDRSMYLFVCQDAKNISEQAPFKQTTTEKGRKEEKTLWASMEQVCYFIDELVTVHIVYASSVYVPLPIYAGYIVCIQCLFTIEKRGNQKILYIFEKNLVTNHGHGVQTMCQLVKSILATVATQSQSNSHAQIQCLWRIVTDWMCGQVEKYYVFSHFNMNEHEDNEIKYWNDLLFGLEFARLFQLIKIQCFTILRQLQLLRSAGCCRKIYTNKERILRFFKKKL